MGLRYLSLIIHLAEPLPFVDLNRFFRTNIYHSLLPFSALVHIPALNSLDVVETLHSSFPDFLQTQLTRVGVGNLQVHRPLASRCFVTMARFLKRDLCGLGDSSLLHDEIRDFDQRRRAIPRALRYACIHWLFHLRGCAVDEELEQQLLEFLEARLLFAIEAYSLLGELGTCVELLRSARKLVTGWTFRHKIDVLDLLYDSWRLTLEFFFPISCSALHVYESAFPHCPVNSKLRLTYESNPATKSTDMLVDDCLEDYWNCETRVINLSEEYCHFALSLDGSQIAGASRGGCISVWDTASGLLVSSPSLKVDSYLCGLALNGPVIALLRQSECILLKLEDGTSDRIKCSERLHSIAFTGDGTKLALADVSFHEEACRTEIIIYAVKTKLQVCKCIIPHHIPCLYDDETLILDFSPDGASLMIATDVKVYIFNTTSGRLLGQIKSSWHPLGPLEPSWRPFGPLDSETFNSEAFFSPDGNFIVHLKVPFDSSTGNVDYIAVHENAHEDGKTIQSPLSLQRGSPEGNVGLIRWRGEVVGVKVGNKMARIFGWGRTPWKPENEEY
ncbi:hypothetical protein CONPUDRAFT_147562 [Coniophora puteana RWD-64-598 SS2]|uniref:WD40 repeat-like protein n=1 Tax=Coniophora puteana (strain RWD-64-598) TaxID=741705 RepID=A0A5M3M6Z9_CONPW|nr:uncharacterized protein CONPUDRAFT_147562 [Coniophora puteana RWD-64-598 SS2]EIW75029.1 hypothetical protein CONPUDRAFT_147562 [Coniophora puteana RWD-64-598 SS2]